MELLRWTRVGLWLIRTCHSHMWPPCSIVLGRRCQSPRRFFPAFLYKNFPPGHTPLQFPPLFLLGLSCLTWPCIFFCDSSRFQFPLLLYCATLRRRARYSPVCPPVYHLLAGSRTASCARDGTHAYTASPISTIPTFTRHCCANYIPRRYIHSHQERGAG